MRAGKYTAAGRRKPISARRRHGFCIRADRGKCGGFYWTSATKLYGRGIKREKTGETGKKKGENTKTTGVLPNGRRENDRGEEREAESGGSFYRTGEGKDERGGGERKQAAGVLPDGRRKGRAGRKRRGAERAEEGEGEDGGKAYRIGTAFEGLLPYGDAGMLDRLHREAEISAVDYLEQDRG